jgi:hypothetical protein
VTVAKFVQPNYTTQSAAVYKAAIDAAIAVLATAGADYACHAKDTPDMQVLVDAGQLFTTGSTLVSNAQQTSATITAPATNPRIDRIVINDQTGVVAVVTGSEAASPTAPAITAGTRPIAQILLQISSTVISNSMITDERVVETYAFSTFIRTLLDDANEAAARETLKVSSDKALKGTRYGNIWSHNAGDVTNDWDISAGGCMDSTQAYWITTAALTKQADVAWAVGSAAGMLDTGAVGNSDYYIWAIARSDTGVTDYLSSLSSTAPTMPANYDYKRLVGWFKRVAGLNVLMDVYETEGGGVEVAWRQPTTDVSQTNTLTNSRRTDAVKVPLNFSVVANLTAIFIDSVSLFYGRVMCPDETDVIVASANSNVQNTIIGNVSIHPLSVRTSSAGLIAARCSLATVDTYTVMTNGFRWERRN